MIYRNSKGELIEININDYINDVAYYKKILFINKGN